MLCADTEPQGTHAQRHLHNLGMHMYETETWWWLATKRLFPDRKSPPLTFCGSCRFLGFDSSPQSVVLPFLRFTTAIPRSEWKEAESQKSRSLGASPASDQLRDPGETNLQASVSLSVVWVFNIEDPIWF